MNISDTLPTTKGKAGPMNEQGRERTGAPLVQSLVRADGILSVIAAAGPGGVSLADIASGTGLKKSTAHHICRTMIELGYVEQSAQDRHYHVGLRPHHIMWQSRRLGELSGAYHDTMLRLSHKSAEVVNLTVPHGHGALVINSLEARSINKISPHTGGLWPLHATASGKIILAHLNDRQRDAALAHPRERFTDRTITDRGVLVAELDRIVVRGAAEEVEEHEIGAACVSVPVFDGRGTFSAAISIAAPIARMAPARRHDLTELIQQEISGIARQQSERTHRKGRP